MNELLSNYTVQIVLFGTMILGFTSGILGSFALLRQQSLLGDAISHATLPGVCIAFMLTGSKASLVLILGAGLAGWIGTLLITLITRSTRIKKDAALGIILSVFFGFGLMLLTMIQKMPNAAKAGLDQFLFGNAATLLKSDVLIMIGVSVFILIGMIVFWKEFKMIVFDSDFATTQGYPVFILEILLTTLIVLTIVIGLQTVGVVLMSAMLVAPAAAARQWTDRLEVMVLLAALFGAFSGVAGSFSSSLVLKLPTGPMIVIFLSSFVLISLLFAPNRGLIWDWVRSYRQKKHILASTMLNNLLLFSDIDTENPYRSHDLSALEAIGRGALKQTMMELKKKGFVSQDQQMKWALTEQGLKEAKRLSQEDEWTSIN